MLGKRIINTATGAGAACTTDTVQILGDTSCVAYYKMNDATDETGSYDGTPTNVNFNVAGKFGNAGDFNGSSSVITLPTALSDGATTNADCISFWFNVGSEVTSSTASNEIMSFAYSGGSTGKIALGSTAGALTSETFSVSSDITTQYTYSRTNIPAGWNHAVVQWNSGTTKWDIYINGVAQTTYTFGTNEQGKWALKFGQRSSFYYDGLLDQVRIFDRAITANEVTKLYNEVYCQPTIVPTDHFEPVIYTGNGGTQSISTLDFQPDFTWIKSRSDAYGHILNDSVRGANKFLYSNTTEAEDVRTNSDFSSFNIDGFTLGTNYVATNGLNKTFVAWNWKAGGAAVTNTDGTITSQVSANTDAGFSVVKHTGTGVVGTVGHGLDSAPELIIYKQTSSSAVGKNWVVYASPLGNTKGLLLNLTASAFTDADAWNNTTPTSTVFSLGVGNDGFATQTNVSGKENIAYCFHSVDGMSKIGSYVGTGASGNSIVTGFRPAFVMVKRTSASGSSWAIFDNKRGVGEPSKVLYANISDSEYSDNLNDIEFSSNGFTLLDNNEHTNYSSNTYIYMAFAEENVEPQPVLANSFNTVTYTGNGGTQDLDFGFKPDLVWIKNRSNANPHSIQDTVTGDFYLRSNATDAAAATSGNNVSSFNQNGITVKDSSSGAYNVNGAVGGTYSGNAQYVAWAWKASNESTINQDGSITSIVSANPAAGFSVVKYSGAGTTASVGHGLSSAPDLVIIKNTNNLGNWGVYTSIGGAQRKLLLNSNIAEHTSSSWLNTPTSTVLNIQNDGDSGVSGRDYIAYCFHSVDGYQKIGSYTGGTSGIQVTTGFKPRWVMLKNTTTSGDSWCIFDTIRSGDTIQDDILFANLSSAESVNNANVYINVNSTGFTVANTFSISNGSGNTYIYLAIA